MLQFRRETYVDVIGSPTATWNVLPVKLSVSTANLLLAVSRINIWDYTINNTFCFDIAALVSRP